MHWQQLRARIVVCATWTVAAIGLPTSAAARTTVEPGLTAEASTDGIRVDVTARTGESWADLAVRLTGDTLQATSLARLHGGQPSSKRPFTVPFESLTPDLRRQIVTTLLPGDRCDADVWRHKPQRGFAPDASFEQLAVWFAATPTDRVKLERILRRAGASDSLELPCRHLAQWLKEAMSCCGAVTVGGDDLLLASAGPTPPSSPADPDPKTAHSGIPVTRPVTQPDFTDKSRGVDLLTTPRARPSVRATVGQPVLAEAAPPLEYGRDKDGEFAVYRLRGGEAVYSSVIMRFTDRVHAAEVDELTRIIAKRSEVESFHDLPIGFAVKVPIEYLAPEFRPLDDPRRQEYERHRQAIARFRQRDVVTGLDGVVVILDPGHGGTDRGATNNGVWESDYVYDIACRIKRHLELNTRAKVLSVVQNDTLQFKVRGGSDLEARQDTYVLTNPRYLLRDTKIGVNLRWYLANSMYRQLVAKGAEATRIVFTSLHADSLHPSVRGAMVYVPAAEHTGGRHSVNDSVYKQFKEYRQQREVTHTADDRNQAEALSRDLAQHLLQGLAARGLPIHEQKPIRGSVLRDGSEWLPAIIRANQVPVRALFEICNLNHKDDSRLLASPAFRQQVAEAYVAALLSYFGGEEIKIAKQDS